MVHFVPVLVINVKEQITIFFSCLFVISPYLELDKIKLVVFVLTHYKCHRRTHIFSLFAEYCEKVMGGYTFPSLQSLCIPVRHPDTDL